MAYQSFNGWPTGNALLSPPQWGDDLSTSRRTFNDNTVGPIYPGSLAWSNAPSPTTGSVWTARSTNNNGWVCICWSAELGLFVALAKADIADALMTSSDGITWRASTFPNALQVWSAVCWSRELNMFVAVANIAAANNIAYSYDGFNWTTGNLAVQRLAVCWSPYLGMFVTPGATTYVSTNGITWTGYSTPAFTAPCVSVCWSSALQIFAAVTNITTGGRIATSSNGTTWTQRSTPNASINALNAVCWSPELGLFVAVGSSFVVTSSNGINWVLTNTFSGPWINVCWAPGPGMFVALSSTGTNRIMTSDNGFTWTSRTVAVNNGWQSVCWAPELGMFAAVANTGTGNRVMTSS